MTTKQALKKLADLFDDEPNTWIQGNMAGKRTGPGPHEYISYAIKDSLNCWCLAGGASHIAARDTKLFNKMIDSLVFAISPRRKTLPEEPIYYVTNWNDNPKRKFSDVKRVLKRACEL